MDMRPIARIRSDFSEKFGIPRQSGLVEELQARVVFEPPYRNPDALRGLEEFQQNGAVVDYYDPFVPACRYKDRWYTGRTQLSRRMLQDYDLAVVTTAHSCVDYKLVAEAGIPGFDCKNVMKAVQNRGNIEVL